MSNEQWKPVVGWEGQYEISDLGNVRGFVDAYGDRLDEPEVCANSLDEGDELMMYSRHRFSANRCARIWLWRPYPHRSHRSFPVWRLVLEAFAPFEGALITEEHDLSVTFLNGDKTDHRLQNIEWRHTPNKHPKGSIKPGQRVYCTRFWDTEGILIFTVRKVVAWGRKARVAVHETRISSALAMGETGFKTIKEARQDVRYRIDSRIDALQEDIQSLRRQRKQVTRLSAKQA